MEQKRARALRTGIVPYLLVLPSMIYLFFFFGLPMINAIGLSVRRESQILEVRMEPEEEADVVGRVAINSEVIITDYTLDFERQASGSLKDNYWYYMLATAEDGSDIEGWVSEVNLSAAGRPRPSSEGRIKAGDLTVLPLYQSPDLEDEASAEIDLSARQIENPRLADVRIWRALSNEDGEFAWFFVTPAESTFTEAGWVSAEFIRPFSDIYEFDGDPATRRDLSIDLMDRIVAGDDSTSEDIYTSPDFDSEIAGTVAAGTVITIEDYAVVPQEVENYSRFRPLYWYQTEQGWVPETALQPVALTDRIPRYNAMVYDWRNESETVTVYTAPDETSAILLEVPAQEHVRLWRTTGEDSDDRRLVGWMQISDGAQTWMGWVKGYQVVPRDYPVSFTQADFEIGNSRSRIISGTGEGEWTTAFFDRMFNDSRFIKALRTTVILLLLILPLQFALAIVMALVLQARIKGSTLFLYIYAIPLGVSDLAAGLVWYSIFTQSGFLNSILTETGLLDSPFTFIGVGKDEWMIFIIVLAEVWRATSIVMVIVVSGLQSIPRDFLEAGELFGANLWQRLRYIVLPLLKPSLQVALILRTILAFQVFAVVIAITGGEVITVLANETYRWYDVERFNNANMAAAYAAFIMVISLFISFIYLRAVRSQEEIERERKAKT